MGQDIWVAGSPSFVGGADTELYHQIILWRRHNIDVHLVPTSMMSKEMDIIIQKLGCHIHQYEPSIYNNRVVVSYCNGTALQLLSCTNPRKLIWFNCMTWTFNDEIQNIRNKRITHLGFISKYQEDYLLKEYTQKLNMKVEYGKNFPHKFDYWPYFDISQYKFFDLPKEYIGLGRISRDDPGKFSDDCWRIFDRVLTPQPKKVFILGISDKVLKKIGQPPPGLDWAWWTPGGIPTEEFYSKLDIMIHKTGGSRESYCRVAIEAMAHGVVPIVERAYAFPEILGPDLDWLMCDSSDEMSYKASQLAFDKEKLYNLKKACRNHIEKYICNEERSIQGWRCILNS